MDPAPASENDNRPLVRSRPEMHRLDMQPRDDIPAWATVPLSWRREFLAANTKRALAGCEIARAPLKRTVRIRRAAALPCIAHSSALGNTIGNPVLNLGRWPGIDPLSKFHGLRKLASVKLAIEERSRQPGSLENVFNSDKLRHGPILFLWTALETMGRSPVKRSALFTGETFFTA